VILHFDSDYGDFVPQLSGSVLLSESSRICLCEVANPLHWKNSGHIRPWCPVKVKLEYVKIMRKYNTTQQRSKA